MKEIIYTLLALITLSWAVPLYIGYIIYQYKGIPHSISDSYYFLKPKGQHHLFTLLCWVLVITLIPLKSIHPLFIISALSFSFVGASTKFKDTTSFTDDFHYIGAGLGIVSALLGVGFGLNQWVPLLLMVVGTPLLYLLFKKEDTYIFWIEVLAFLSIIWGLWF